MEKTREQLVEALEKAKEALEKYDNEIRMGDCYLSRLFGGIWMVTGSNCKKDIAWNLVCINGNNSKSDFAKIGVTWSHALRNYKDLVYLITVENATEFVKVDRVIKD